MMTTTEKRLRAERLRRLRESLERLESWSAEANPDAAAIRGELVHMRDVAEGLRYAWTEKREDNE